MTKSEAIPAWRLLLVIAWVIGVNLWCSHHLGWSILTLTGSAIFVAALGWAKSLVSDEESEGLKAQARASLRVATHPLLLTVGCALFLYVGFSRASMTIVAPTGVRVWVHPVDEPRPESPLTLESGASRSLRLTNAGGRDYVVDAEGYRRRTLSHRPWTGTRVVVEQDLELAPCLLIRLSPDAFSRREGGKVTISDAREGGEPLATFETSSRFGSIMVGLPPSNWRQFDLWERELDMLIALDRGRGGPPPENPDQGNATKNRAIVEWMRPQHERMPGASLRPGRVLDIEFKGVNGQTLHRGQVALTRSPFHDVLLEKEEKP